MFLSFYSRYYRINIWHLSTGAVIATNRLKILVLTHTTLYGLVLRYFPSSTTDHSSNMNNLEKLLTIPHYHEIRGMEMSMLGGNASPLWPPCYRCPLEVRLVLNLVAFQKQVKSKMSLPWLFNNLVRVTLKELFGHCFTLIISLVFVPNFITTLLVLWMVLFLVNLWDVHYCTRLKLQ